MRSGYVGVYNQGSTCYLNSVIQGLYHLPAFRTQIFTLPGIEKDPVALALRNVFAQLEVRSPSITTTELTSAFGWSSLQAATQHDVHELTQQLFECLETTLKDTPHKDFIRDMFGGLMIYRSRAVDGAKYLSDRLENFYDVELVVQDKANIEESLSAFVSGERIEGVSVEQTPGAVPTLHTIERSQHFLDPPKVLLVHPNRVTFDLETLDLVTLRNVWSFADTLSLENYIIDEATLQLDAESREKMEKIARRTRLPPSYSLRAILIHAGDANTGHYYAYVKIDSEWLRFNDEIVETATEEEVSKSAFGGQSTHARNRLFDNERASLLIYINDEVKDELLRETDPPSYIQELGRRLEEERSRKEETQTVSYYVCSPDLVDILDRVHGASARLQRQLSVRVPVHTTPEHALLDAMAQELRAPPSHIHFLSRGVHGFCTVTAGMSTRSMYDLHHSSSLFVDVAPPEEIGMNSMSSGDAEDYFLVFLRGVKSAHELYGPASVIRSRKELHQCVPKAAVLYESHHGSLQVTCVTADTPIDSGANLLYTLCTPALETIQAYLAHRQLVTTKVYLYDDLTAERTKLCEVQWSEDMTATAVRHELYKQLKASTLEVPKPPSEDYLAFFVSSDKRSYAFATPIFLVSEHANRRTERTLRDLWGRAQREHRVILAILPLPLGEIDPTILVTLNGGYKNMPHVYVPLTGGALTFRELLKLTVNQLGYRLRSSVLSGYQKQLKGEAPQVRLLNVRDGELISVSNDLDAVVDLDLQGTLVMDKLSPTLPGHECVDILFCRRRSGEHFFGLPTNICIKSNLEERCDVLLRRIVKKLNYPDEEEAIKKWILCVMNVRSRKTRTASKTEVLSDLAKEVGGAPFVLVVDRPQCLHLDGIEAEERYDEAIIIKSASKVDLSALS